VGQVGKSAETRLNTNNDDYGRWLSETMDELKLSQASVIGISYGGFLLQKLMQAAPQKITKGIFVVPGGFVNGPFFKSMLRLSFPLIRFLMTKSEKNLLKFMDAFYISKDAHSVAMQKHVLLGVKVDFNRPPLLKPSDVYKLEAPVYALVADDDIFFPGNKTLERCRLIFKNFKGSYVLKNTRHIPDISRYKEIEVQIRSWLSA
jgi:pimeloyl-ACP methyl ester carboxylesterase